MPFSRREFIATSAATVASASMARLSRAAAPDISDIRVAVIGFHGQGAGHISNMKNNVVALCDVDGKVLAEHADRFDEKMNRKAERFTDYRKLLERKDIDAVSIATPNHTHALIGVAAMQAGKDVYVEKPVSHNIWEGRQLVAAARKYDRIVQTGTHSRSSGCLQEAEKFLRSGRLGKIQYAVGTCYKPRPSIGKSATPLKFPSYLNRDLWVGPAADTPIYRPKTTSRQSLNPHYDWHFDFNTGNGDMGNQGIHQMDIARWFLGEKTLAPRVISMGGRLGYDDAGDTPNTQVVYHDYPNAPLIFETRGLPRSKAAQNDWENSMDSFRSSRIGVIVQCEHGYMLIPSGYEETFAFDNQGNVLKRWTSQGNTHFSNWLEAVAARDRSKLEADILEGHLSSSLCHTGAISNKLGTNKTALEIADFVKGNPMLSGSFERMASHLRANQVDIDSGSGVIQIGPWLELDTKTETFTNSDAANQLRSREKQRAPHIVPDIENS